MNLIFILFIQQIICRSSTKSLSSIELIQYDCSISDLKTKDRPMFIRAFYSTSNLPELEERQWNLAAEMFPHVKFVEVDCSYNTKICNSFNYSYYSAHYGYVPLKESNIKSESQFSFSSDEESKNPQKFIDIIYQYDGIYPVLPPIIHLYPYSTDCFYHRTNEHPIFLLYNSSQESQASFISAWTKSAGEELYDKFYIGLLDCDRFPSECSRWLKLTTVSPPTAIICNTITGNQETYNSYSAPITYELVHGLAQNTDVLPIQPTPTPVSNLPDISPQPSYETYINVDVEEGYALLSNSEMQERSPDQIRAFYDLFKTQRDFSPCENSCDDSIEGQTECNLITPSTQDHQWALNLLRLYRWLAGLTPIIDEDNTWSSNSAKLALNLHKIGGTFNYDDTISDEHQSSSYCGSSDTAANREKSLIFTGETNLVNSLFNLFKNDDSEFLLNRRMLLKPELNKIGLGFYHEREMSSDYGNVMKPSVAAFQVSDYNIIYTSYSLNIPGKIDFISWPPPGYFPIDELPKVWHVTHPSFNQLSISDLEIAIFRDDGTELPILSSYIDKNYYDQSTLILRISDHGIELCVDFSKITVSIKNTKDKEHIFYSFELFSDETSKDFCFYVGNDGKCPTNVESENRYKIYSDDSTSLNSSNVVRVYVYGKLDTSFQLNITDAKKAFIYGDPIPGTVRISSHSEVYIEDPSQTNIIIEYDYMNDLIGQMNSRNPKSTSFVYVNGFIDESNTSTVISQKILYSSGNDKAICFAFRILEAFQYDIFYYFSCGDNDDYYLNVIALRNYDIFYDSHFPTSMLPKNVLATYIDKSTNLCSFRTNKRVVKLYANTQDIDINMGSFITNGTRKRDYEFYTYYRDFDFYCDININNYANSILFDNIEDDSYDVNIYNGINPVFDRGICSIPNITIGNLRGSFDCYSKHENCNFYYRYSYLYANSEYLDISSSYYGYFIVTTSSKLSSFTFEIYSGKSYTFHPDNQNFDMDYTFDIVIEYPLSSQSYFYFENYYNLYITEPLFYYETGSSDIITYHHLYSFTNCCYVTFINQPEVSFDRITVKNPISLKGGCSTNNFDYGIFTVFDNMTLFGKGRYHFANCQFNRIKPSSKEYTEFYEMVINDLITIDSVPLDLIKCKLLDRVIVINLIRSKEWPILKLHETDLIPSEIRIDLNYNSTDPGYERHILISGLSINSRCKSIIDKVKMTNNGNYAAFCSDDDTYLYVQKSILTDNDGNNDDNGNNTKNKGLSKGAIAGIVIGCIVAVAIIIFIIVFIIKKNQ